MHARGLYLAVGDFTAFGLGGHTSTINTLEAEGAFFDDPFGSNGNVRIELIV